MVSYLDILFYNLIMVDIFLWKYLETSFFFKRLPLLTHRHKNQKILVLYNIEIMNIPLWTSLKVYAIVSEIISLRMEFLNQKVYALMLFCECCYSVLICVVYSKNIYWAPVTCKHSVGKKTCEALWAKRLGLCFVDPNSLERK